MARCRNRRSVEAGATRRAGLVGRLWDEVPRHGRDDRQRYSLTALVETQRFQQHPHAHLMWEMTPHKRAALATHLAVHPDVKGFAGMAIAVDVLENDKAVVPAGHSQAAPQRRENRGTTRLLRIAVLSKKPVKVLVMTHLVFGDATCQKSEHGLGAGARQSPIVTRRTRLDDAA